MSDTAPTHGKNGWTLLSYMWTGTDEVGRFTYANKDGRTKEVARWQPRRYRPEAARGTRPRG